MKGGKGQKENPSDWGLKLALQTKGWGLGGLVCDKLVCLGGKETNAEVLGEPSVEARVAVDLHRVRRHHAGIAVQRRLGRACNTKQVLYIYFIAALLNCYS